MDQVNNGLRRAALLLHAMSAPDVAWLLQQLERDDAARLQLLLEELRTLGLPRQSDLLQQAARQQTPPPRPSTAPHDAGDLLQCLRGAEVQQLAAVLRNEPPGLVARLLDSADWPWRADLLEAQGPHRRRQIEECCTGACPPALSQALLEALWPLLQAAALPVAPVLPAAARPRPPLLGRLAQALRPNRERLP